MSRHLSTLGVCGKEGIRTPETLLTFTRFPGGPVQPLLHLSVGSTKIEKFLYYHNFLFEIIPLMFNRLLK